MGVCIRLFVLAWAVVDRYSVVAAVIMSAVALVIPPLAAIVANRASAVDRRGPGEPFPGDVVSEYDCGAARRAWNGWAAHAEGLGQPAFCSA